MFIDRLQIHSMLEDWSIDACECSGETSEVEKKTKFQKRAKQSTTSLPLPASQNENKLNQPCVEE